MIYYKYSTDKKAHQFEYKLFWNIQIFTTYPLLYLHFFNVSTMHAFFFILFFVIIYCKSLPLMMSQLTTAAARGIYIYRSNPLILIAHTHQSSYTHTHTRCIIKHLQLALTFSTPKNGKPCRKPSHIGFKNRHPRSWSKRHSSCKTAITPQPYCFWGLRFHWWSLESLLL